MIAAHVITESFGILFDDLLTQLFNVFLVFELGDISSFVSYSDHLILNTVIATVVLSYQRFSLHCARSSAVLSDPLHDYCIVPGDRAGLL